eukprot:15186327-Heterocapsa_arctica.AAC.1
MESSVPSPLCAERRPRSGSPTTRSSIRHAEWKPTPSFQSSEWGWKGWYRSLISHAKVVHSSELPDQLNVRHRYALPIRPATRHVGPSQLVAPPKPVMSSR